MSNYDHVVLIAAMNPCPCGFYGDTQKPCICTPALVTKYQKRISDPLLNRIDIHIEVPRVDCEKLSAARVSESSESIRGRVQRAWDIQLARFSKIDGQTAINHQDFEDAQRVLPLPHRYTIAHVDQSQRVPST